jgi:hypothetical protein
LGGYKKWNTKNEEKKGEGDDYKMAKVLQPIKSFIGLAIAAPIAGATLGALGSLGSSIPRGISSATQSLVGLGLVGKAAEGAKSFFKMK